MKLQMVTPNMSCLGAVHRDVARMVVDTATMDMVLVCRKEEIRAHSFILQARSPVFHSMLTLDTKERRDRRVLMEEVEVEVVREMVSYMYTADLDTEFDQLEELLVLANRWEVVVAMVPRYSVLPLVERVGSLLAARLTPTTALHLGALGEAHQADALLTSAARCLLPTTTLARCLAGDLGGLGMDAGGEWVEQGRHSPRLVMAVVEALRQGHCRRLEAHLCPAAARRSTYGVGEVVGATKAHVDVTVSWVGEEGKPLFLTAVGLFTVPGVGVRKIVRLEVVRMVGLEEVVEVASMTVHLLGGHSSKVAAVQEVTLPKHVVLQPGARSADF